MSENNKFALEFDIILGSKDRRAAKLAIYNFVICFYDGHYSAGFIDKVDDEEYDNVKVDCYASSFPLNIILLAQVRRSVLCTNSICNLQNQSSINQDWTSI